MQKSNGLTGDYATITIEPSTIPDAPILKAKREGKNLDGSGNVMFIQSGEIFDQSGGSVNSVTLYPNQILLAWKAPDNGNSQIIQYLLVWYDGAHMNSVIIDPRIALLNI